MSEIAVIVPVYRRLTNLERLTESFYAQPVPGRLILVVDDGDDIPSVVNALSTEYCDRVSIFSSGDKIKWSEKIQLAYENTAEPLLFYGADDITFGINWWVDPLRMFDMGYAVVGTNDMVNPRVVCGQHATHMFVSRKYIDQEGAALEGPGTAVPTCYRHCFADDEIIQIATARGLWGPCLTSQVPHHHPIFGGAPNDRVYAEGNEAFGIDQRVFAERFLRIQELVA